ncbi:hypothetical protein DTO013E5_4088 [Penicillium roqueforti]|nr:hypothetical protein CBS147337_2929 [Penicillium roqueforti]KAI2748276.1 hypothetical protein DTO012A1_922 [Penicillium roqueforti]KAI2754891.1 hypothetical protein DTO013F2_1383 [Penicillium roqueforti]KAI2757591.1 hypothetical protein DTO006G1_7363 [Penicillium roqueforti]KAI2766224.1 hypothetical protein DTO012A8_8558 [Penicillium roqueforti]
MANYNGRRMPNFSQYLDDLNAIPSPYDQAQQQQQQQTTFNDEDLALFTNTEFFEFDKFTDFNGLPSFSAEDDKTHEAVSDQSAQNVDLKFLDFLNAAWLSPDHTILRGLVHNCVYWTNVYNMHIVSLVAS